jgi:hypothetical protein
MSAADNPHSQSHSPDAEDDFSALLGDDIQPLQGKGANHMPKPSTLTPGVLQAAQSRTAGKAEER